MVKTLQVCQRESCEDNGLFYIGLGQSCGEDTDMSWAVLW